VTVLETLHRQHNPQLGLSLSSVVTWVWMAVRILKDPNFTGKTFDDYFYQDREDICRNEKE